jgi:hypothetical protein
MSQYQTASYFLSFFLQFLTGPTSMVFARPFLIVVGTNVSEQWQTKFQETALFIAYSHYSSSETKGKSTFSYFYY